MGIKVDDKDTIEIASEMDELSDITLSKTQVLLVQPHGMSSVSTLAAFSYWT